MNFSWLEFCFQEFFEKIFCYTLVFQTDLVMGRGRVEKMKRKVFVYDSIFFAIVNNLFWNLPWSHRAFSGARLLPISIYHKWIIFFWASHIFPPSVSFFVCAFLSFHFEEKINIQTESQCCEGLRRKVLSLACLPYFLFRLIQGFWLFFYYHIFFFAPRFWCFTLEN